MSSMSLSSPTMSDKTLLLSVEDLISIAMGSPDGNAVDFKMVQTVLHILARQMRLLEQKVVLVAGELPALKPPKKDRRRSSVLSEDSIHEDDDDGMRSRQTSVDFRMEGRDGRRSRSDSSTVWRGRDGGKRGKDEDGRDRSRGGRGRDDDGERGGQRGRRGGRESDEEGGRGGSRGRRKSGGRGQGRDRDDREGSRGRRGEDYDDERRKGGRRVSVDSHDDKRGGRRRSRGRGADDYDDGRGRTGSKGRGAGGYDDERGGRTRSKGRGAGGYDDERGGRTRSKGRGADDDDGGSRGRSRERYADDYDDEKGGRRTPRGRGADDYDDDKGGRGRSRKGHDDYSEDGHGGRGRSRGRYSDDEEDGSGRGRSRRGRDDDKDGSGSRGRSTRGHEGDEDERGGRGRSKGRGSDSEDYEDGKGGHGKSRRDRKDDDDGSDGRARSRGGGRDDEDGSDERGKSRGGRMDDDGGSEGRGRSRGGRRDGEDETEGRGRSGGRRDRDDDEGSRGRGRGGRGREDEGEETSRGQGKRERGSPGGRSEESRSRVRDGREDGSEARGKGGKGKGGIGIREVDGPGRDKVLVVVKSPISGGSDHEGRDSIAVVTQSQFRFLIEAVDELRKMAGPLPALTMPDNVQLRKDLAAGASLTDTMQAMQVEARVKAAEETIGKLGGLLTQLAASGALPSSALTGAFGSTIAIKRGESGSTLASKGKARHVTEPELVKALKTLRDDVTRELQNPINKAASAAESAESTARFMGGKVEELLKLVPRINDMSSMMDEYAQQLDGFDAGLNTQLSTFKEQLSTMRADLQSGVAALEAANNNAETAAVMELNERYEELVRGLEDTLLLHTALTNTQHQLTLELKNLADSVEMLREQKADMDELIDGLRDKADMQRLEGLVRQEEFEAAREDLEQRITLCLQKFDKQDEVWREVVKDLEDQVHEKALVVDLIKMREDTTTQLRDVDEHIKKLEILLGEPEAAILMRALSRGAVCGACLAPAVMRPGGAALPPTLPAARPRPPELPCAPEYQAPKQPDLRSHKCHRWVGGSHTMMAHAPGHAAPPPLLPDVTRKYTGYGDDGRLYWMETATAPCVECNPDPPPATARTDAGAGDAAVDADADAGLVCTCSEINFL